MVYKEIKNKIPSLSSLLLAGSLFGGSGCKNCDRDKAQPDATEQKEQPAAPAEVQPAVNVNDDSKNTGKKNLNKEFSTHLAELVKKFKQILIKDCTKLDYLNIAPAQDRETREQDLRSVEQTKNSKDKALKLLEILRSSCDLLANVRPFPVPKELEGIFAALQNLPDSAIAKSYPYACVLAVEKILGFFESLYDIKERMFKSIDDLMPKALAPTLVKELDELEKKAQHILQPDHQFIDNAKSTHSILDGPSLSRFFQGKSKRGTSYPEVKSLFYEVDKINTVDSIWIKFKQNKTDKGAISSEAVDPTSSSALSQRGIFISDKWKVEGGEKDDVMPKITAMDNLKNPEKIGLSYKFSGISGTEESIHSNENDKCIKLLQEGEKPNSEAAVQSGNISLGQLVFFTLARGKTEHDFIELTSSDFGDDYVKLIGKNQQYLFWKEAALAGVLPFAEFLGKHIQNNSELQDLFVIPNVTSLESSFLHGIDETKPANSGSDAQLYVPSVDKQGTSSGNPGVIGPDGESIKLFKNILSVFSSGSQVLSNNPAKLEKKIKELGALSSTKEAKSADLTFNQRVAIQIAKELENYRSIVTNMENGSAQRLSTLIKNLITDQVDKAIVKLVSNAYVNTPITARIRDVITKFDEQLDKKSKNAHVTYTKIKDDKRLKNKGFEISKVREVLLSGCTGLKAVIQADVVSTIQIPIDQQVNYVSRFQEVPGMSKLFDKDFDQIRQDYHNKLAK